MTATILEQDRSRDGELRQKVKGSVGGMSQYFRVGDTYFNSREQAIKSNTHFEIERGGVRVDKRFHSREYAIGQIKEWRADNRTFSVHEMQNAEVTRKSAKGNIFTETVHGSLERVPRIISVRQLNPTFVVVSNQTDLNMESRNWGYFKHFQTRAEAEQERAKWQNEIETLAAFTEADVKLHTITDADIEEVDAVLTLADLLERDADKIKALESEISNAQENCERLGKQAEKSIAPEVADLNIQIAALAQKTADLKVEAATRLGLPQAQENLNAAIQKYNEAIRLDGFEDQALEKMREDHNSDCWPNSECRVAGECTWEEELGAHEIEEYLLENAEKFKLDDEDEVEVTGEPETATA
jgi:hypothetical protein